MIRAIDRWFWRRRRNLLLNAAWGQDPTKVSLRREAKRRRKRLAQLPAVQPPRPTLDEYQARARLGQRYRSFIGVRDSVIRDWKPLLEQARMMREFLNQSDTWAKVKYWWVVVLGAILGAALGAIGSGATYQMTYSYLGNAQVLFNGAVLFGVGLAVGVGLARMLYLLASFHLAITKMLMFEHADPDSPRARTGRIELLTYRLAWASQSGRYFGGPSLESGMLSGIVKVDLPHMQRIDELDQSPYRVVSRKWEYNTPTTSLWPRVHADHTLTARREAVEYAGLYPYDLQPAAATWTGNADREREDLGSLAKREGQLSRRQRRGVLDTLLQNPGYTGGIAMLVLAFLLMAGWQ